MSGAVHTPGPWKPSMPLKAWDGTYSLFEIHWSDDGECVAEVVHGEANARLIAAAPCLLTALEAMVERYTQLVNCGDCGHWNPEDEQDVIQSRAAIAKAKGGAA